MTPKYVERFWSKVDKNGPVPKHRPRLGKCWVWTDHVNRGYGQYRTVSGPRASHRISWELSKGALPKRVGHHGVCVLHKCDNRRCVRPSHLFIGTIRDNTDDKVAKQRQPRRESHGRSKLTDDQVASIRRSYALGGYRHQDLADQYGVCKGTIGFIIRNETWK